MGEIEEFTEKMKKQFRSRDTMALKELSNQAIERAILTESRALVNVSLVSYSLSKLLSKPHLFREEQWKDFEGHILDELSRKVAPEKVLGDIIKDIADYDRSTGNYLTDLIDKARVKQASRAYALGLSLGRAAELTGADKTNLLDYVGMTRIHERPFTKSRSVEQRFKNIKKLFGD